ncbi:MAG TPA: hypothetical protein QGH10_11890 [Armatimonadota bacterium]|nr:hypothetical protein [Armatimonadota bacterium]
MTAEQDAALRVLEILEDMGVGYVVGGSYASSVHGVPRSTNDLDLTAARSPMFSGATCSKCS